jgi:membrane dipeptidase
MVKWMMLLMVAGSLLAAENNEMELKEKAQRLAQKYLLVDTHIDVPYRLNRKMEDISQRTESGDFDFPRARKGGLDVPFMSIYIPAKLQEDEDHGMALANEMIDMVERFEQQFPDKFTVVHNSTEAALVLGTGKVGLAMGMENGAPVNSSFENLAHLYKRGIRYITLTHSKDNHICDSSYDDRYTWNGLSPFGKKLVPEMNRLGIMIDVSHVTDSTFYQVMELSKVPVIASHSSCRHFTPGFERNMSDDMIKRIAGGGGVVQINFGSSFLNDNYRRTMDLASSEMKKQGIRYGTPEFTEFIAKFKKEHPAPLATVGEVADHIERVISLAGIDHVGLGSDYDGVGETLPEGLEDVSGYPNLIEELLKRGHNEEDIEKICGKNLMRVWREVEQYSASLAGH